ncbi:hypothetical protein G6F61_015167 [Rhizopus arrhizus]|nr:hypothetical protein G6F61_015167 [Rhizopus arrhizus]
MMLPPAPARFSTTTVWPSRCDSGSASRRASVSAEPPGAKPTSSRTGFVGFHASAAIAVEAAVRAVMANKAPTARCRVRLNMKGHSER